LKAVQVILGTLCPTSARRQGDTGELPASFQPAVIHPQNSEISPVLQHIDFPASGQKATMLAGAPPALYHTSP
jgi:hypothetical protein